jgi:acetoin utilization deacetylase AcuC-like enzyme
VHPNEYVELVRETCARGAAFDLDTPTSPGSWEAALHSAGAGCAMVDSLLGGQTPTAFCTLRPPGHHAEPGRAMGFCLFSNVALAARHALESGVERVMVVDWDVHHGNGTNAALHDSPEVLFASLHRYPFYPGTGPLSDAGSGEGAGFSLNLPLPGGSGEEEWLSLVEHVVAPVAVQFRPELVLVSAGYDAHRDDPLGGCLLETRSYHELGRWSRVLGERVGAPVGCVLEGGYDLGALASSVAATMEGLSDGGEPQSVPAGPLVDRAAEQVGRFWSL